MFVEIEREEDGRWIAEVPALRGAMAYGATKKEAVAKVEALAARRTCESAFGVIRQRFSGNGAANSDGLLMAVPSTAGATGFWCILCLGTG